MKNCDLINKYLDSLHPLSDNLELIKKQAFIEGVPIIQDEVGRLLKCLCELFQPKTILELGTGFAYSTHWILLGYLNSKVITIDQNQERTAEAIKFLKMSNLLKRVTIYNEKIETFFKNNKKKFDMIFLDSEKQGYKKLLPEILFSLKPKGLLVADNTLFKKQVVLPDNEINPDFYNAVKGIKEFNAAVFDEPKLSSFFFSLGDGVLISKKN